VSVPDVPPPPTLSAKDAQVMEVVELADYHGGNIDVDLHKGNIVVVAKDSIRYPKFKKGLQVLAVNSTTVFDEMVAALAQTASTHIVLQRPWKELTIPVSRVLASTAPRVRRSEDFCGKTVMAAPWSSLSLAKSSPRSWCTLRDYARAALLECYRAGPPGGVFSPHQIQFRQTMDCIHHIEDSRRSRHTALQLNPQLASDLALSDQAGYATTAWAADLGQAACNRITQTDITVLADRERYLAGRLQLDRMLHFLFNDKYLGVTGQGLSPRCVAPRPDSSTAATPCASNVLDCLVHTFCALFVDSVYGFSGDWATGIIVQRQPRAGRATKQFILQRNVMLGKIRSIESLIAGEDQDVPGAAPRLVPKVVTVGVPQQVQSPAAQSTVLQVLEGLRSNIAAIFLGSEAVFDAPTTKSIVVLEEETNKQALERYVQTYRYNNLVYSAKTAAVAVMCAELNATYDIKELFRPAVLTVGSEPALIHGALRFQGLGSTLKFNDVDPATEAAALHPWVDNADEDDEVTYMWAVVDA